MKNKNMGIFIDKSRYTVSINNYHIWLSIVHTTIFIYTILPSYIILNPFSGTLQV